MIRKNVIEKEAFDMKQVVFWVLILFMFVGNNAVWADIATRDEVSVKVELMNGARFPSFEFYIRYQSYHYDMGYQPDPLTDVVLEAGKPIETGQRGARSFLYARDKKSGRQYASKKEIGGTIAERGVDVSHYVDQIEVLSLRKGEVKFKVVARKRMNHNGEVMEILKGDVTGGKANWLMILVPIICLSGLVAFFLLRRKPLNA